jgi:hypothetical protein
MLAMGQPHKKVKRDTNVNGYFESNPKYMGKAKKTK